MKQGGGNSAALPDTLDDKALMPVPSTCPFTLDELLNDET